MDAAYQAHQLEMMTRLVECLRDVNTPHDAALLLDKLIEIDPRNTEARQLRRRYQMWAYEQDTSLNKPILALKTQSILSKAVDDSLDPMTRLDIAEEALAHNPFHHKANLLLAQSARMLGWGPMVTLAYETLVYRYPGNRGYEMEQASIYTHHEEPERALEIYEAILEDDPDDLDAYDAAVQLERDLEQEGRSPKQNSAAAEPPSDRVIEELEAQLKELEEEQQSLREEINRMTRIDDETRGLLAEVTQRVDMAHLDLLEAESLRHPQDPEILYHLGQAREKVGMFSEAYEAYEKLLDSPDTQEEALLAMTTCLVSRAYQRCAYAPAQDEPETAPPAS